MTPSERELLLSLAKVVIDGAGFEERVKIERLRSIVERAPIERERIVAAAVLWLGATVTMAAPARHHTIMQQIGKNCPASQEPQWGTQGFITNVGRFVDREEAFRTAMLAKQIIGRPHHPRELFSEDLW